MEAIANDKRVKYFGGMGAGKEIVDVFTEHMRSLTTLDWDYFIREKDEDELFPWEMISTGVDKSWLLKMYKKAKEAQSTPVEEEGCLRKPCYVACTVCGVCKSVERGTPEKPKFDQFWPEAEFGKGRHLPQFKYEDHAADAMNMEEVLDDYIKPQKLRVIRLEVDVNPKYRYVDSQKLKYRIRRACNRAGIPIRTDVTAASQKILEKAWYSGKEIYELYSADKRFIMSEEDIVKNINANFADDALIVTKAGWYTGEVMNLGKNFEFVLYSITFNDSDYNYSTAFSEVSKLNTVGEYPVKLKVKSKTKRDAFETVQVNVKDYMYKTFVRSNGDGTWTLFTALSENMTPYDFAATLLHTAKRNLYKYPVIVEEFMLRNTSGASLDMFAEVCLDCGEEIETNIWGEPISSDYCLEHKYLNEFAHREIDVQGGYSEEFMEEADEDDTERFNKGEVTMDDDTDLEDEILKKVGNTGV